jgi:hypothetical protein
MRRTWIKLFCDQWLRGSIRKEASGIRGIFADLLAMAGDSAFGDDGTIQLAEDVGFNDHAIGAILNVPLEEWLAAKERLSNHPDPSENRIEIVPLAQGFSICILNWKRYQSEYTRQKPYRAKSPLRLSPSERKRKEAEIEGEGEGEEKVTKVTSEVTEKVTDSLPPIPKQAPFKVKDELKEIRHRINEKKRLIDDPDDLHRWGETPESLQKDIDDLTRKYQTLARDYGD